MYFPDEMVEFRIPQSVIDRLQRAAKVAGAFKWMNICPYMHNGLPVFSALLDLSMYIDVYLPSPTVDYTHDADVWLP